MHVQSRTVVRASTVLALLTLALAALAAQRTISSGVKEAESRQAIMAAQVGSRMDEVLAAATGALAAIDVLSLVGERVTLQNLLDATLAMNAANGWTSIQVVAESSGQVVALAGTLDHVHHGEGYAQCSRCAGGHELVIRGIQGEYGVEIALDLKQLQRRLFGAVAGVSFRGSVRIEGGPDVLLQMGADDFFGDSPIESGYAIKHSPQLRVVVVGDETVLTSGVRIAVWTQLAATLGFALLMFIAYKLLRQSWEREVGIRERAQEEILQSRQRTAHMDRLATMGTLAASVAHELASPLTYVTANVDLAAVRSRELGDEDLAEMLDDGRQGCARMRTILSDMRTFAHPGTKADTLVDLRDVIASAGRLANSRLRHVADLDVELTGLPAVRGNASRLGQVFLNLFVNAADALAENPAQGGAKHWIKVRGRLDEEGSVQLSILDSGAGVPEGLREKIFESFYTTKEPGKGTGLGLAICREIIEEHGGELSLAEAGSDGACFEISLPTR